MIFPQSLNHFKRPTILDSNKPMENQEINDKKLLAALQKGDGDEYECALEYIYLTFKTAAQTAIERIGGVEDDIKTAFAPGLVNLAQRVNSKKFTLNSSLESVFISAVTDAWAMAGLRKGIGNQHRDFALIHVDKEWSEVAKKTLKPLGAKEDEITQAFENASKGVLKWILKPESMLFQASLNTYYAIAVKREWFGWKKNTGDIDPNEDVALKPDVEGGRIEDRISDQWEIDKNRQRFLACMNRLCERCKNILTQYYNGVSMKQLAKNFAFASDQVARNEKRKCMEKLIDLLPPDLKDSAKPPKGRPRK